RSSDLWARSLGASTLALALAACTVGPDFVRPDARAPDAFVRAEAGPAAAAADQAPAPLPADAEFWHGFGDPQLTALVEDALAQNNDLKTALARYDQANALLRGARFDLFPTVTASGEASDG